MATTISPPTTLIESTPELLGSLDAYGWAVLETDPDPDLLIAEAIRVGKTLGATTLGYKILEGTGSLDWLLKHTEGITHSEEELIKFFALGCVVQATSGGATTVYDGRTAAKIITENYPEIADVRTLYTSTVYPGQQAVHPLVFNHPAYGPVIRYRSKATTNQIIDTLPSNVSTADFYSTVERVLEQSIIAEHTAKPGEILVVNNLSTIHSRAPYDGERKLVRVRYDDPNNPTLEIGGKI